MFLEEMEANLFFLQLHLPVVVVVVVNLEIQVEMEVLAGERRDLEGLQPGLGIRHQHLQPKDTMVETEEHQIRELAVEAVQILLPELGRMELILKMVAMEEMERHLQ
jgi:hypothetical protein